MKRLKKIVNHRSVKLSSTLGGQRELVRELKNKVNELVDLCNFLLDNRKGGQG